MVTEDHGASQSSHVSVMLHEAVNGLAIEPAGRYIDATYGRGGHSALILNSLGSDGRLLAVDRDPDAIADAERRFGDDPRFTVLQINFADLQAALSRISWLGEVDGLLMDLGVSSPQLDDSARGFGFSHDAHLDMRMDPATGQSAAKWLAHVSESELARVFKEYGEERYARRIAKAVVRARSDQPITRTAQLAEIIKQAHPRWERHHHPATRCFQAIRITINNELDAIAQVLRSASEILRIGGRLCVISFHSLEDRMVKRALRRPIPDPSIPRHLPQPAEAEHPWRTVGKAIKTGADEIAVNPRARSAVLRVAERIV
ncbi:MAG: 16S rRNA (cytosine(1402)-N(4))-methyltransferase RsmH [Granulosicoccus sp.]|nr:16S rRNA (cytosine(1402)-N(4))-methyltransferase RsmH [Granulosicoccus sp.]